MTRELYYEMCYSLDMEPNPDDIPIEYGDLPVEVQEAIEIYNTLQDSWEGMSGTYMGKSWLGLADILDIFDIAKEDRKDVLNWIRHIDAIRINELAEKQKQRQKSKA